MKTFKELMDWHLTGTLIVIFLVVCFFLVLPFIFRAIFAYVDWVEGFLR